MIDQIIPLCGDKVTFYFRFSVLGSQLSDGGWSVNQLTGKQKTDKPKSENRKQRPDNRIISHVSFTGSGCAISIASSSMLSSYIKGKSIKSLEKITGKKVLDLVGTSVTPARLKCVFLPLEIIRKLKDN